MTRQAVLCTLAWMLVAGCATGSRRDPMPTPGHDAGHIDLGVRDAGQVDLGTDAGAADLGLPDEDLGLPDVDLGPPDADAGADAGVDAGVDSGLDAGPDAGVDRCRRVDCSALTAGCFVGVCVPATGACTATAVPDGTACTDGNLCTTGDACTASVCAGVAVDCSALSGACGVGACNAATGGCHVVPVMDGTSCGAMSGCASPLCAAGACVSVPSADCVACGPGSVCAAGLCGAPPATLTYDFESRVVPAGWTNGAGGTAPWTLVSGRTHGGTGALRSGSIGDSAVSRISMPITLSTRAIMSFWLNTSTESCCDHLELWVDGVLSGQWQGTTAWTQASAALVAGAHTLEWLYTKDGSVSTGSDAVWIDDVTFVLATSPGTDFEGSAALPAGYTTGGTLPWVIDTSTPHAGANAAASGPITDLETSSMFRSVTLASPSPLTFWYRVQSEPCCDHLLVYDNGTQLASYQGEVPWALATFPLATGTHRLEWRYSKDGSVSTGLDRAFVDDIDFGFTPGTGPLCGL